MTHAEPLLYLVLLIRQPEILADNSMEAGVLGQDTLFAGRCEAEIIIFAGGRSCENFRLPR